MQFKFDWGAVRDALTNNLIIHGAVTTVWLAVAAMAAGFVIGLILALMRRFGPKPLVLFNQAYIWLFRGTPLLVQLIVIYTGLPQFGIQLSVVQAALLGFSLNEAAYESEVIRAGLESVPQGQTEAARALGMRPHTVFRTVTFPQAMRIMIPNLGNSFNLLIKGTSLASVISLPELLRQTESLAQVNFKVLEMFTAAGIYYLAMTTVWSLIQARLEAHFSRGLVSSRPAESELVEAR